MININNKNYLFRKTIKTNWFTKFQIWQFNHSGWYFDDLYSTAIDIVFLKCFILPGLFFFDRYFSYGANINLFNYILSVFNNIFFFDNFNIFYLIFFFLLSIINLFIFCIFFIYII